MRITPKQRQDIELVKFFIPKTIKQIPITEADEIKFLENSEQGKHRDDIKQSHFTDGFNALVSGKQWRGRTIHELWEEGVLEGTVGYWTLLGGESKKEVLPRIVVDFMKKEMFKGIDAEIIERCYQQVLWRWTPWYKKLWKLVFNLRENE